jgi:hypothetical protein
LTYLLLTKEIEYFIGATIEAQEESISAVIGGSNIFYVIDDLVLFPTWLMVDAIIQQLD